ncbi:MAG: glycoside hydrolase family 9 protein [Chloroflexota bacterium]
MLNKKSLFVVLFALILILSIQQNAVAREIQAAQPLPDIQLFTTDKFAGWAGSGNGLTIENDEWTYLPLDETNTYNGQPSLRINVSGDQDSGGWWESLIAGPDWESYSIEPYMANGSLEFNVKGAAGGENFTIGINDIEPGREPFNVKSDKLTADQFITVSTDWQKISIPLSSFAFSDGVFNSGQMFTVALGSANTNPLQVWVADIRFTTPDLEPSFPAVKPNQLGYRPDGIKQAIVSGFADQLTAEPNTGFSVRKTSNNEIVFEGNLQLANEFDQRVSGERVFVADFSGLEQTGEYYIAVDAYQVEDSIQFQIENNIYGELVIDSMRYFYLQRSGIPIEEQYAGEFARGLGHPQDAEAQFRSGDFPPRDVSGGWYDAGDYGKYVNAGATAVSDLLWTYELFPEQFSDNHLNIPESGNGVSDLLDEIRWELDWMMRMQDPESGGFYHMVQPTTEELADVFSDTRYIEDVLGEWGNMRPTSTTGSAVAALAHAAVVYAEVDSAYAQQLQASAVLGYTHLENTPDGMSPVDGAYSDWDDQDNRFWAAAALYRLTGEEKYHEAVKALYPSIDAKFNSQSDNAYGVPDMAMIGWLSYMYSAEVDPVVADSFEQQFNSWSDHMVDRWENSTWNHTLLDEDYYWGSNYAALTTPLVLYAGQIALGQDTATTVAISQQGLDYLLGSNPLAFSYVSGYGPRSVKNIYSTTWSYDQVENIPAGVLAGGPNEYSNPLFYPNYAGKRYFDGNSFWTLNEHTVYWNSALVFNVAMQAEGPNAIIPENTPVPTPEPEPTATPAPTITPVPTLTPVPTMTPETDTQQAKEIAEVANGEDAPQTESNESVGEVRTADENQGSSESTSSFGGVSMLILAGAAGAILTLIFLGIGLFIWRRLS